MGSLSGAGPQPGSRAAAGRTPRHPAKGLGVSPRTPRRGWVSAWGPC